MEAYEFTTNVPMQLNFYLDNFALQKLILLKITLLYSNSKSSLTPANPVWILQAHTIFCLEKILYAAVRMSLLPNMTRQLRSKSVVFLSQANLLCVC